MTTTIRTLQSGGTRYAILETDVMEVQFLMQDGETAEQAIERSMVELDQRACALSLRAARIRAALRGV